MTRNHFQICALRGKPAILRPLMWPVKEPPHVTANLAGAAPTFTVVQSGRLRRPRAAAFLLISKAPAEAGQIQPLATPKIQ
jgi:hypothetical protein